MTYRGDVQPAATSEIHRACRLGWTKGVKALLEDHADPNMPDAHGYGNRPLHYAAEAGHDDAIRLLLQRRADINARNYYGYTPLHEARPAQRIHRNNGTRSRPRGRGTFHAPSRCRPRGRRPRKGTWRR